MAKLLKEPSTYAGLAAVVAGVGQIFKDDHTDAVAAAINQAAPHILSNDWLGALMTLFGLAAVFLREKGNTNG